MGYFFLFNLFPSLVSPFNVGLFSVLEKELFFQMAFYSVKGKDRTIIVKGRCKRLEETIGNG